MTSSKTVANACLLALAFLFLSLSIAGQAFDIKRYQRLTSARNQSRLAIDCCTADRIPTTGLTDQNYTGQLWKFMPVSGGFYKISNFRYEDYYCLDVEGDQARLKKASNARSQLWKITPDGQGYYYLSNAQSGTDRVLNDEYKLSSTKGPSSLWRFTIIGGGSVPSPASPRGKVSKAVYTSVKAIDLMDQASTRIIDTRLLGYTPVKWALWEDKYYYTTSAMNENFVSHWHLVKAFSQISVEDAIRYAYGDPNIKFFVYVIPGGYWNEVGKGNFQPYTALFFSYQQPILRVNPQAPQPPRRGTVIYEKIDYLNQHIVTAQSHSRKWRSQIRPQMIEMLSEVDKFGAEFDKRYQSLLSLATQITNGNNGAIPAFKNELKALQQVTQMAARKAQDKEPAMISYLDNLAEDIRNFTADHDKISSQLAGSQAEIKQLKANIEEYKKQRRKNLLLDIFVPIMGIVDAAKGSSEKLEKELREQSAQLAAQEKEQHHLKAISGRLNGLTQAARAQHASILALVQGWNALNADFQELIQGEDISTEMVFWLKEQLKSANDEWKELRKAVNSIR
jgi:uncharacterized coiled-coil DUF342 family protein